MNWPRVCLLLLLPIMASCAHEPQSATPQSTASTRPAEIRRGMLFTGSRAQRQQEYYKQLLARIEPSGHGDVHRLAIYLDFFKREFIRDPRLFAFQASAEADGHGKINLRGFVEFEEQHEALKSLLRHLGFSIGRDEMEVLPSSALGARCYAIITADRAFIYDRSGSGRRETLDECRRGDRIFLLKPAGAQFLCHAADGYVGYIDASSIERMDAKALAGQASADPSEHSAEIRQAIDSARRFLGTKYVWGGTTATGIDCSGLVRRAYGSIGVALPRDADQQALVGRLVAARWNRDGLRPGDTLYFLSRRGTIHHTALYIGDHEFIEATEPVAKISSFDPVSPRYSKKRDLEFCFARRILTSPDRVAATRPLARRAVVARPPIVTREQWGSKPRPIAESARQTPSLITLHHAGVYWKPGTDPVKFIRSVQAYGQKEKGWPDLPYHFMIAPDGRIFEGCPLEYAPQSNTQYPLNGHIGIELMGNFEVQRPSLAQLKSAVALSAWLCEKEHIDPGQIAGHKDRAPGQTVCPGRDFYRYLADGQFVGWVRQTLAGHTPAIEPGPVLPGGPTVVIDTPTTQPLGR